MTLVATVLHDPGLKIMETFARYANDIPFTEDFVVLVSKETPIQPYTLLLGDKVIVQSKSGVADARREALGYFLNTQHDQLFLLDFDRLLYWLEHDKHSFYWLYDTHIHQNMITVGRTEKAMLTHPEPQRSTERAINTYVASALYKQYPVRDIIAGVYIMTSAMAQYIASNSFAVDPGAVDVEWYILAHQQVPDADVSHVIVDGLGYEGLWLGLEPDIITPAIHQKRQLNLERAVAFVDIVKFWGGL